MRITLRLTSELYDWITEQAQTDDSNEVERRKAVRRWFYELAGMEAPDKLYKIEPKSPKLTGPVAMVVVELTDEAGAKICELAGVDPAANSTDRNLAILRWLSAQAGLPLPLSQRERARARYHALKRKAEAFDSMRGEGSDG